jgi:hypothetical protein
MAHEDVLPGFKDAFNDRPASIEDGDKVYWTVVAVAGHADDWAAYMGFGDPYKVARSGDKLDPETAARLFPIMVRTGRRYRL